MKRGYGWIQQEVDDRDYPPVFGLARGVALPPSVDPTSNDLQPIPYDQGATNSCVGHAIKRVVHYDLRRQGVGDDWSPSALFIYSMARIMEGTLGLDEGCVIRDAIKAVVKYGVCGDDDWPLKPENMTVEPPKRLYDLAQGTPIVSYSPVIQTLQAIKSCLVEGNLVIFGFKVFPAFESDKVASTGIVPMPSPHEVSIGGHAVCISGYRDDQQCFILPNSYGRDWGMPNFPLRGYFTLPYSYVLDPKLSFDFWTIKSVMTS